MGKRIVLKTLGSKVRTSVWPKFFVCLFVFLFGEGKIKGFRGICALRVPFSSCNCLAFVDIDKSTGFTVNVFKLNPISCMALMQMPRLRTRNPIFVNQTVVEGSHDEMGNSVSSFLRLRSFWEDWIARSSFLGFIIIITLQKNLLTIGWLRVNSAPVFFPVVLLGCWEGGRFSAKQRLFWKYLFCVFHCWISYLVFHNIRAGVSKLVNSLKFFHSTLVPEFILKIEFFKLDCSTKNGVTVLWAGGRKPFHFYHYTTNQFFQISFQTTNSKCLWQNNFPVFSYFN